MIQKNIIYLQMNFEELFKLENSLNNKKAFENQLDIQYLINGEIVVN